MKFGQLIEYNKRNIFFFKNHAENEAGRLVSDLFKFFKETLCQVKAGGLQVSFNIFRQPATSHKIKTNCIKLQTIDPELFFILIFQKSVWKQFLHQILCMISLDKCFPCYILLTNQVSFSDCVYFLRYWETCVLQLFVSQVAVS